MRRTETQIAAIAIMALGILCAVPAEGAEKELIVRASAVHVMPDLSYETSNDDGFPIEADSSSATGLGLGFEVLATPRVGIAFQFAKASPTIRIGIDRSPVASPLETRDDLDVTMYAASLNLHLTPDSKVDVYVSPVLAYLSFGNLGFVLEDGGMTETAEFEVKKDVAWGIGVGADFPIGDSGWLLNGSVTYLDSTIKIRQLDESDGDSLGFDPLMITAGVGYRF